MTRIILNDPSTIDRLYYNKYESWKDYVCDNFDENVVLYGNSRDIPDITEASWYTKYDDIIEDAEQMSREEFKLNYIDEYSLTQIHNIYNIVNFSNKESELIIKEVVEQLDPSIELESTTLHGMSSASDWKNAIYIKDSINTSKLANFLFGDIISVDIYNDENEIEQTDYFEYDNELFNDRSKIKENLRNYYDIPQNEELVVQYFSGYSQVANYETIE